MVRDYKTEYSPAQGREKASAVSRRVMFKQVVDGEECERTFKIQTYWNSDRKALISAARVTLCGQRFERCELFRDYNKVFFTHDAKRVNEKALAEAHAVALANAEPFFSEALAQYQGAVNA